MENLPQENTIHNSKLIQSLKVFSSEELKPLGKWLQSPWTNSNKKVYELYFFLKKHAPTYNASNLNRANTFKKLFPDKPFNDRWLRNIMAELNKQVESFLIHQRLEEEEDLKKILLAKEYEKRHQTKRLLKLAGQFNEQLEAKKNKELEDYYYGCYLNDLLYYSPETSALWKEETPLLNMADAYLDRFYLLAKWRYRSEFKERQRLLREEKQPSFDITILEEIGNKVSIPAIDLYQQKMVEDDNLSEEQFNELKQVYFGCFESLAFKDQQIFYFYLLNALMGIIQSGKTFLFEALFDLYWFGIEEKLLMQHNRLSANTFANIVTLGNSLRKTEIIENFINSYTVLLSNIEQLDGKTWGLAHWHFNKKEYNQSIELLWQYKFKSHYFDLQGRILLLKTYLESLKYNNSYALLFYDFRNAFLKYLVRNKKISNTKKKGYKNLIKYSSKIADLILIENIDQAEYLILSEAINKEKAIQGKKWMLETLKGLSEKK